MEKGSSGDLFEVVFKEEVTGQNDTDTADVWGGRQSGVIDGEAEVVNGFSEGFGTNDLFFYFTFILPGIKNSFLLTMTAWQDDDDDDHI